MYKRYNFNIYKTSNGVEMEFKHKFIRKIFIVNEKNTSISLDYKD